MSSDETFRVATPQVIHETVDGEVILIHLERGTYHSLRGSGALLFEPLLRGATPRELEAVCQKAMAKAVGQRYCNGREFADDLQRFLRGVPVHARAIGPFGRVCRWCIRHPLAAGLLLGGFLKLTPYARERNMSDEAVYAGVEKALRKYFGKRGDQVVQDNLTCVKRGYGEMQEIPQEMIHGGNGRAG